MDSYSLSRQWFDWCFENPEKINPNHGALYFYIIEQCNRMGWKEKFGLPTEMAKDAIGIKSYNTFINTLRDLVEWGFVKMIEKSKNQYSANIIALLKNDKAHNKALDKAIVRHLTKQDEGTGESTGESICSIDKPINQEPINQKPLTIPIKKSVVKKSKTNNPFWKRFIETWFNFYESKFSLKPTFEGAAVKALQTIIKNLENVSNQKNEEWSEENAIKSLTGFLEEGFKDPWLKNHFLLPTLSQKFDVIVNPAKKAIVNYKTRDAGKQLQNRSVLEFEDF